MTLDDRLRGLMEELAAIPAARRTPAERYVFLAVSLAVSVVNAAHAAELERLVAERAEERVPPPDDEQERVWTMITERGPGPPEAVRPRCARGRGAEPMRRREVHRGEAIPPFVCGRDRAVAPTMTPNKEDPRNAHG
jgi:hypothetical protein